VIVGALIGFIVWVVVFLAANWRIVTNTNALSTTPLPTFIFVEAAFFAAVGAMIGLFI